MGGKTLTRQPHGGSLDLGLLSVVQVIGPQLAGFLQARQRMSQENLTLRKITWKKVIENFWREQLVKVK